MNLRKIKLDLTVALMNNPDCSSALKTAREVLEGTSEAGNFTGMNITGKSQLDSEHFHSNYAMTFENCTLDLQMISNRSTNNQYVSNFSLR